MKKLFVLMIALIVIAAPVFAQANLLVNGDFETGDETGWTRWQSPWGSTCTWGIEDGMAVLNTGNRSFGWHQAINVIAGHTYEINGQWMGNGNANWCEVLFFNDDGRAIYDQLDSPVHALVSKTSPSLGTMPFKVVDGNVTMGSITEFLAPASKGGILTNKVTATGSIIYVGLKTGTSGGSSIVYFDDFTVNDITTPEPGSMIALLSGIAGFGGLVIRRRK